MNKVRAIEINIDDEEDFEDDDALDFGDDEFDFSGDFVEIYEPDEEERVYAERPNKTQIKKEISAIAELAEELAGLTLSQIKSFELPEMIENSLIQATAMPHKGARKRQLKYITAALRKVELEPVQERLARLKSKSAHAVREHHLAERWRDKLVADTGNDLLTELLDNYPAADSQQVRQLQRNAKKELATGKPPKSARLLYKYLKVLFEDSSHQEADFVREDSDTDLDFDSDKESIT
jgi:ribosome-associated protein